MTELLAETAVDLTVSRDQLAAELAHWRYAIDALADLDVVASPEAWAGLEQYLHVQVQGRLAAIVAALRLEAAQLDALARGKPDPNVLRDRLLLLRRRYFQAEAVLDFYGDAIATRTNPELAALLRGFDTLASDGLQALLQPLGIDSPPVLVYLDTGPGAAILRVGVRLWDQANPSPAAAIKLTGTTCPNPRRCSTRPATSSPTSPAGAASWVTPWHRCCAEGRPSWPRCGGVGPARWPRTSTPSPCAGGRRCRLWATWSTVRPTLFCGLSPAIRIRSR